MRRSPPGEVAMGRMSRNADSAGEASSGGGAKRGMVLPFSPLAMSFDDVRYFVDMPAVNHPTLFYFPP